MRKLLLNTIKEIEKRLINNEIPIKFQKLASFLIGVIKIFDLIIAITYRLIILLVFVSVILILL